MPLLVSWYLIEPPFSVSSVEKLVTVVKGTPLEVFGLTVGPSVAW